MERLVFWNIDNKKIVEPGKFNLMVGGNSNEVVTKEFIVRQ